MFLHVTNVEYVNNYRLQLTFSDDTVKVVDLEGELYGEIFEPLKIPRIFKQVYINPDTNTIEWPNGADFAPEFLFEIGRETETIAATQTT